MLNTELRQKELEAMKVAELKELIKGYGFSRISGLKKLELVQVILDYEYENDEESQAANEDFDYKSLYFESFTEKAPEIQQDIQNNENNPIWWNLVCEMNMKDNQPFIYEHVADRPLLQQIMLNVCRDLYLDSQRAIKAFNGDKTVKQFGPVYVGKKHSGLHMKDAMAKATVKAAAEKVLSKDLQKKFIVLNPETKHTEFRQAVQVLNKLNGAGLIHGDDTDKEYAKFYSVYPEEILAFLKAVGCLKK
jgi:hypothetical protein